MSSPAQLYDRLSSLNAEEIGLQSVDETKEVLADQNAEQMFHGITSEGENFKSYASEEYAEYKHSINPLPGLGNPDLRLKGGFYQGIIVTVVGNKIVETSTDEKMGKLGKHYGIENIFGLSPLYKREYKNEALQKQFINNLKASLQL